MGFITEKKIAVIDANSGLKMFVFSDYKELVKECLLLLTDSQFADIVFNSIVPHCPQLKVDRSPKPVTSATQPNNRISAGFLRRMQGAGCQCGKQKLEGMPLCGICFTKLANDQKKALRNKRGGELENAYNEAVDSLRHPKEKR